MTLKPALTLEVSQHPLWVLGTHGVSSFSFLSREAWLSTFSLEAEQIGQGNSVHFQKGGTGPCLHTNKDVQSLWLQAWPGLWNSHPHILGQHVLTLRLLGPPQTEHSSAPDPQGHAALPSGSGDPEPPPPSSYVGPTFHIPTLRQSAPQTQAGTKESLGLGGPWSLVGVLGLGIPTQARPWPTPGQSSATTGLPAGIQDHAPRTIAHVSP